MNNQKNNTAAPAAPITFKRLPVGAKFAHKGDRFRKVSTKGAFKLLPTGIGQTHAQVPFTRSAACQVID